MGIVLAAVPLRTTADSLSASGLAPDRVFCRNLTTGQEVVTPSSQTTWSCTELGLAISRGDRIETGVLGRLPQGTGASAPLLELPLDFALESQAEPSLVESLLRMQVADLDGDGDDDVIVPDNFFWYENRSQGSVDLRKHLLGEDLPFNRLNYLRIFDVDGDGRLDIVGEAFTGSVTSKLVWYRNDGAVPPRFGQRPLFEWPGYLLRPVAGGDMDGDGDTDVLAELQERGTTCPPCRRQLLWLEQRQPVWTPRVIFSLPGGDSYLNGFTSWGFDMDGDGDLDALVERWDLNTLVWFENDGGDFSEQHRLITSRDIDQLEQLDWEGDGDLDLLAVVSDPTGAGDAELRWLENRGTHNYSQHSLVTLEGEGFFHLIVGDVSGDGLHDLILTNEGPAFDPGIFVWLQNLGGSPPQLELHRVSGLQGARIPVGADINHDGRYELVDSDHRIFRWYENRVGLRLRVSGMTVASYLCRNYSDPDVVLVAEADDSVDCQHEGLEVAPGDRVQVSVKGTAD